MTHLLTEKDRSGATNALQAAASRWREWSVELARSDVAESFRNQAKDADRLASHIAEADAVALLHAPQFGILYSITEGFRLYQFATSTKRERYKLYAFGPRPIASFSTATEGERFAASLAAGHLNP